MECSPGDAENLPKVRLGEMGTGRLVSHTEWDTFANLEQSSHLFEGDVTVCPRCGAAMRIVAFVPEPAAVQRLLAPLVRTGVDARAGPWAGPVRATE